MTINTNNTSPDNEAVQKTLKILEDKAKKKQLINYGELYSAIGLNTEDPRDRNIGAAILAEVNMITIQTRSVMVSSLVVLGDRHYPAHGFFEFAVEQGRMNPTNDEFQRLDFWVTEVKKVFEAYDEKQ